MGVMGLCNKVVCMQHMLCTPIISIHLKLHIYNLCLTQAKLHRVSWTIGVFNSCHCRKNYDVFSDESAVDPSVLKPAKMLQWRISPSTVADIQTASRDLDK